MSFIAPPEDLEEQPVSPAPAQETAPTGFTAPKKDRVAELIDDDSYDEISAGATAEAGSTVYEIARDVFKARRRQSFLEKAKKLTVSDVGEAAKSGVSSLVDFGAGLIEAPYRGVEGVVLRGAGAIAKTIGDKQGEDTFAKAQATSKARMILAGNSIEENLSHLGRSLLRLGGESKNLRWSDTHDPDTGELIISPEQEPRVLQEQNDSVLASDFDAEIQARRNAAQIEEGNPLNTGVVASIVKATGDDHKNYTSDELESIGAKKVDPGSVRRMAAAGDVTNLIPMQAAELPFARYISGAATKAAGKTMALPQKILHSAPGWVKKSGYVGKLGAVGGGAELAHLMVANPVLAGKMIAGAAVTEGGGMFGRALVHAGDEAMTGIPSKLSKRVAAGRINKARGGGLGAIDINAEAGKFIGDTVVTSGAAAIGSIPIELALADGDPKQFLEAEFNAMAFRAGLHSIHSNHAQLAEAARPHLRELGAGQIDKESKYGSQTETFLNTLPEADRNAVLETVGALGGTEGKSTDGKTSTTKIHVLSEKDYLQSVADQHDGSYVTADSGGNGFFISQSGEVFINGGGSNLTYTIGHEAGGHAAINTLRALGDKGAPVMRAMMTEARQSLYGPDGKPTPEFQRFIEAYNSAFDPTGKTKAIDANNPNSVEEYLAESAGVAVAADGAAGLALPKGLADKVQDTIDRFGSRILGLNPDLHPLPFDRTESRAISDSVRRMLETVARAPRTAQNAPENAPGAPEPAKAPKAPEQAAAEKQTVPMIVTTFGGGVRDAQAAIDAVQAEAATPLTDPVEIYKAVAARAQKLKEESKAKDDAERAKRAEIEAEAQKAAAQKAASDLSSVKPAATPATEPAPLPNVKQDAPAQETSKEPVTATVTAEGVERPVADRVETPGTEPKPAAAVPSDAEISTALTQADETAAPKMVRAKSSERREEIKKEARLDALKALLPKDGDGLRVVVDDITRETSYEGDIDSSNRLHRAILNELGVAPEQEAIILDLQSKKGKGVVLRDYNSAEQEGFETGEGIDLSNVKRKKELVESPADERGASGAPVSIQDKGFTPYRTVITKSGKVVTLGFDHDKFLDNTRKVLDAAKANGEKTGFEGLVGAELDKAISDTFRNIAANHANGLAGTGKPLKGIEANPDRAGIKVDQDRVNTINMAMHNRQARPPKEAGKTDLSKLRFIKRQDAHREAVGLADRNKGFLDPLFGETNALRSKLEAKGFQTDKQLKPVISNIRPDLIGGGIHETPGSGKSVHASGLDIPAPEFTAAGVPRAKQVAAGFQPKSDLSKVTSSIGSKKGVDKMRELLRKMTPDSDKLPEGYYDQVPVTKEQAAKQNEIAKAYDALKVDNSADPDVVKAYENLAAKVNEQMQALLDSGVVVEPWNKEGEPYESSLEMQADIRDNSHLYYFKTEEGSYGSGELPKNHPMLKDSGIKASDGTPMLNNDAFRAVHDGLVHAATGSSFGPVGEEAAWKSHLATIDDPLARRALTTETRGQNSWVNFRDKFIGKDGMPLRAGDEGYVHPKDRPYADQKFDLLPEKYSEPGQFQPKSDLSSIKSKKEESYKLPTQREGTSKAWVQPDGKIVPLKGWHADYLNKNAEEAKKLGLKNAEEITDSTEDKAKALDAGYGRINLRDGTLIAEFAKSKFNTQAKASLRKLIEDNIGDITRVDISLFSKGGKNIVGGEEANVFRKMDKVDAMDIFAGEVGTHSQASDNLLRKSGAYGQMFEPPRFQPKSDLSSIKSKKEKLITLYRGESSMNKGGRMYHQDQEFARQFTQSGRDSEIKSIKLDPADIFRDDPLPYGGDTDKIDASIAKARKQGFKAIYTDEGSAGEPSVLVIRPKTHPGQFQPKTEIPSSAEIEIGGKKARTGTPVTFEFRRGTASATKEWGIPDKDSAFDRGYEPSGEYMIEKPVVAYDPTPDQQIPNTKFGVTSFENPIVIDAGNYGDPSSWKRTLSEVFGGKTGKNLSKAIIADGYDGIITVETDRRGNKYTGEIVDLTTFNERKAKYQPKAAITPQEKRRTRDMIAQSAWFARKAAEAETDLTPEMAVDFGQKWRKLHPHESDTTHGLPDGYLEQKALRPLEEHRADAERSRDALLEQKSDATEAERSRVALEGIVAEAKKAGRVFGSELRKLKADEGVEHEVLLLPGRVIKITHPNSFGGIQKMSDIWVPQIHPADAADYLKRIELQNKTFGDDIRVEGVVDNGNGDYSIVTTQPNVKGRKATTKEIQKMMEEEGFTQVVPNGYYHVEKNIYASDVRGDNVAHTPEGLFVLDAMMTEPDAQMREWMTKRIQQIEDRPDIKKFFGEELPLRDASFQPKSDLSKVRKYDPNEDEIRRTVSLGGAKDALSEENPKDVRIEVFGRDGEAVGTALEQAELDTILGSMEKPETAKFEAVESKSVIQEKGSSFQPKSDLTSIGSKKRPVDDNGLFSELRANADDKLPNKASAEQIKATLNKSGAKKEELEYSGINEWLDSKTGPVTKQEVLEYLDANNVKITEAEKSAPSSSLLAERKEELQGMDRDELVSEHEQITGRGGAKNWTKETIIKELLEFYTGNQTKYEDRALHGGTNYKERLFTLPAEPNRPMLFDEFLQDRGISQSEYAAESQEGRAAIQRVYNDHLKEGMIATKPAKSIFTSSHWNEPNVVLHTREADHTTGDARKGTLEPVRLIEEIQSDWHQKGRKEGYKGATESSDVYQDGDKWRRKSIPDKTVWFNSKEEALNNGSTPDAPFKKSWPELGFKVALDKAIKDGKKWLAWTTGKIQGERYDLSKQVDGIRWDSETQKLSMKPKGNSTWQFATDEKVSPDRLEDYVGKEAARKLLNEEGGHATPGNNAWIEATKPQSIRKLADDVFGAEMAPLMPFDVMDGGVLAAINHDQIKRLVVSLLAVDVVNDLAANKLSPDDLFSNHDMVAENLPIESRDSMAKGVVSAVRRASTTVRAKLESGGTARGDKLLLPTLSASDLNSREVAGLLSPESIFHGDSDVIKKPTASATSGAESAGRDDSQKLSAAKLADFLNSHTPIDTGNREIVKKFIPPRGSQLEGKDLSIESAGMKGFYDDMLGTIAKKFAKKYGSEIRDIELNNNPEEISGIYGTSLGDFEIQDGEFNRVGGTYKTYAEAKAAVEKMKSGDVVHALRITPEIAEAIKSGGQPMFQPKSDLSSIKSKKERAPVFYSALSKAIEDKMPSRAPVDQVLNIAEKSGVKSEEIEWSGLKDWLGLQEGSVSKEAVQAFLDNNGIQVREVELQNKTWDEPTTRHSQYQLPGGNNYRELVLTAPKIGGEALTQRGNLPDGWTVSKEGTVEGYPYIVRNPQGAPVDTAVSKQAAIRLAHSYAKELTERTQIEPYKPDSVHFTEEGGGTAIAWARFNDRTTSDGGSTLFLEEVQSKRHQDGREKGYKTEKGKEAKAAKYQEELAKIEALGYTRSEGGALSASTYWQNPEGKTVAITSPDASMHGTDDPVLQPFVDAYAEAMKGIRGVPDAPFKKTWPDLVLKRMIRYAAENGYDSLSWTTGDQQNERWNLAKHVREVRASPWRKTGGGPVEGYHIEATGADGRNITDQPYTAAELPGIVGNDLAAKIIQDLKGVETRGPSGLRNTKTYKDLDLKTGGSGMRKFYDEMLTSIADKLGKKYGAKVKKTTIDAGQTRDAEVHIIPITPELRDAAMNTGFPLFQPKSDLSSIKSKAQQEPELRLGKAFSRDTAIQTGVRQRIAKQERAFPEALPVTYQREAGKFVTDENGRPKPEPIPYGLLETPLAKSAAKGIRGDEQREQAVASAYAAKLEKEYRRVQNDPEIMSGGDWYRVARTKIKDLFGDDALLFAQLLGATSARTPAGENYEQAIEAYNGVRSGKYDGIAQRYIIAKRRLEEGADMRFRKSYRSSSNDHTTNIEAGEPVTKSNFKYYLDSEGILPRKENGKKFNANSLQVLQVIAGTWEAEVGGPKTPNFAGNLAGKTLEATIDVWAARGLHRLGNAGNAERWRILPESEKAVDDKDFFLGQKAYREAAKKIGINPDDLQGVLWFAEKREWEKNGWTRGTGAELADFNTYLNRTDKRGDLMQVRRKHDTTSMFGDLEGAVMPKKLTKQEEYENLMRVKAKKL